LFKMCMVYTFCSFASVMIGGSHCGNDISFDKQLPVATMPLLLKM